MPDSSTIELNDVVFKRNQHSVLDGLTFSIETNKLTALMGPSGVGKTTIIKLITAQEKPLSGTIRVFGEDIHRMNRKSLYEVRKRIGVLFQSGALLTDFNVFENVALPLNQNTKFSSKEIKNIVATKLDEVGLLGAMELYPRELSGGMARRVAIARSLVLNPDLIMYDEPFVGQDPITMAVLVKLINTVSNTMPITSLAISHDVKEILSIADYGYLVSQGQTVGQGTPKELLNHKSPYVTQFLKGLEDGPVSFHYPKKQSLNEILSD